MSAQSTPSELRKRSPSSSPSGRSQKDRSLDSTRQLKPSYRPNNALRMTAIRVVVAGLLGFFGLRAAQKWGRSEVPDAYALCSPEGKIFTVDEANPEVECMVIHGSHFSDVGSLADIRLRWTAIPVRFIQSGAVVVPGISDSHVHILEYGATIQLPLEGPKSVKETVQVVRNYILSDPDVRHNKSTFVEGWGWDHTQWLLEQWPTSEDLENDPVVRGRPIVLQSKDGHAIWVSKKILDDIEFIPEEIEGGTIFRDSNGNPTGVFMDSAQSLVNAPEPTHDQMEKRFGLAVRDAHKVGLTALHDAGFNPRSLAFFKKQAEEDKLPIRVYGMTYFNESAEYWGNSVEKVIGAGNNRLSARSVKIFADGALRSGGAALYEPYSDNPETRGFLRIDPELLNKVIPRFLRDGWQVNVHAIGDRANGVVLDAFEAALKDANVSALRPRLEHAQILAKKDMARFGDLGIIASIQPTHAISDMWFGEDRLVSFTSAYVRTEIVCIPQYYRPRRTYCVGFRLPSGRHEPSCWLLCRNYQTVSGREVPSWTRWMVSRTANDSPGGTEGHDSRSGLRLLLRRPTWYHYAWETCGLCRSIERYHDNSCGQAFGDKSVGHGDRWAPGLWQDLMEFTK
ncbi:unnamed protein product [Somion occarium]|uniref:Amidohydrolase 3 domain-containing protein n=1 Tax=Somion occarium TaxID=3059160 RepID=A0ABP1DJW6_9APHY